MPTLKSYSAWGGLDYRSNDLVKSRVMARDNENSDISERGALTKRFGTTTVQSITTVNQGVWGLGSWTNKSGTRLPVAIIENDLYIGNAENATAFTVAPKVGYLASLNADSGARLRGCSFASMKGTLYIATGTGPLLKYDGEMLHLSGAPTKPITSVTKLGGVGQWTATKVSYKFTYNIADGNGVFTVGAASPAVEITSKLATDRPSIILPALSGAADGYKIKDAGPTVTAKPTINTYNFTIDETLWTVGDLVFRWDGLNRQVTSFRLVEKIGTNLFKTDTLFTDAMSLSVGNVFVQVARSIDDNPYEICAEMVIQNGLVPSAVVDEGATPYTLGIFEEPQNAGYVPLKPKYVSTHRTQVVVSGIQDEPQAVYFSDILYQEAYSPSNSFIPGFNQISEIKGTASFQGALLSFTGSNIFVTSGILDSANGFATDPYPGGNIGALNQNGIVETDFGLVISTASGPWVIKSLGAYPEWFGERVANYFIDRGGAAVNSKPSICWLPSFRKLMITASDVHMLVYDAKSDTWHRWAGCNSASTSLCATNQTAYFVRQTSGGTVDTLRRFNSSYVESDYNDDGSAISMFYKTAFDAIDEWSQKKKYLRLKVFRSSDASDNIFTQAASAFDVGLDFYYDADTQNVWSTSLSLGSATSIPYYARTKMPNKKGYALSITFKNSQLNKKLSISGFELELEILTPPKVD